MLNKPTNLQHSRLSVSWNGEPLLGSTYGEEEIQAAVAAMRESMEVSVGFGTTCQQILDFEAAFALYCGTKHAIAVNSAGPGLDMAMRYLKLEPGDEVIVPAINFMASPLAIMGAGGQCVWGEVDPRTLQLDPTDVKRRLTPRTRAIFPVHMNGLAAPMDDLLDIAQRHPHPKHGPLKVIGDAARACGGEYKGWKIGKHGFCEVFSFHTMKNMVTLGEGGMLTTDDDDFAAYCRSTRFYGIATDVWGTSNVMTKIQAAVGLVQLKKLDGFVDARRRLAARRNEMLAGVRNITLPYEPPDRKHSYYLYTCLVPVEWAGERRDAILKRLDQEFGVKCMIGNPPVYETRKLLFEHGKGTRLPLSDQLGKRIICPPIHPAMSDNDNKYITSAFAECVESMS
jgi:perosamine synthetase